MKTSWVDLAWQDAGYRFLCRMRFMLEVSARRYHAARQAVGAAEHKFWKFEYCPAVSCREVRETMERYDRLYALESHQEAPVYEGMATPTPEEVSGTGPRRAGVSPLAPEKS